MTFTLPRWALVVLLISVGGAVTILASAGIYLGYEAHLYLNVAVAEREETHEDGTKVKIPVRRYELIDAILAERFAAKPQAAEQGK